MALVLIEEVIPYSLEYYLDVRRRENNIEEDEDPDSKKD
jgi:hypothetical protein